MTGTEGQIVGFDADGKAVAQSQPGPSGESESIVQFITASCTWTAPFDMEATIICAGAGAGGGGSGYAIPIGSTNYRGFPGGGGASGFLRLLKTTITKGTKIQVTIGKGGKGGNGGDAANKTNSTSGSAGGTTSFGALLSAPGGEGGTLGRNNTSLQMAMSQANVATAHSDGADPGTRVEYNQSESGAGTSTYAGRGGSLLPFGQGGRGGARPPVNYDSLPGDKGGVASGGGGGSSNEANTESLNGAKGGDGGDGFVLLICTPI